MRGGRARALIGAAVVLALAGWAESAAAAPSFRAPAAVVLERDLGVRILSRRADAEVPVASTTKLMTAYVALRRARLDRVITVAPYTATGAETVAGLHAGERLSVGDVLKAMLLPSGGDAAHTLAVDLAGSTGRFVGAMNAAAARLHLDGTHFTTEVGLDTPGNHSTASDLARLTAILLGDPFFARTVARPRAQLANGLVVVNRNRLVGTLSFVVGVKTGHTRAAGYCLVGAARRDGATVISVVLGDPSEATRDADTLTLLRYGLSLFHGVTAVRRGHVYARVAVDGRPGERVALVAARSLAVVVRRGAPFSVYPTNVAELARGPLPSGSRLGELAVKRDGRVVARVDLVTRSPLAAPATAASAGRRIVLAGGLVGGVLVLVGCSLSLMRKRRAGRGER
ncbi:MAG: hypothetical protein QOF77_1127 [Solirubrobacteraceae bacterium]|jgi:D-alanyl-D-alanine carboxypeptidase (penicillin-binding protein 5/6)|nr:hypothetical protein [Solirubrobacteraceae bacterium]